MTKEPTHADIPEDDNEPATKGDVRKSQEELAGMMATSFQGVTDDITGLKQDVTGLKKDVASLKSGQAAILNVVNSIDEQLKEWKGIPAKVERLHKAVFPHR